MGIDATIRQWSLQPEELRQAVELAKMSTQEKEETAAPNTESMLTADEEAELAELMGDD